jgi:Resolvase, N terminal domain
MVLPKSLVCTTERRQNVLAFDDLAKFLLYGLDRRRGLRFRRFRLLPAGCHRRVRGSHQRHEGQKAATGPLDGRRSPASGSDFVAVRPLRSKCVALAPRAGDVPCLGIEFVSLSENVDTSTPMGKMVFTVLGAVAELERAIIVERVRAGLNARAKGRRLGRPRVSVSATKIAGARFELARHRRALPGFEDYSD